MLQVMADHWLNAAKRQPSPNCDHRPDPNDVSLVVVHCISLPEGEYGTGSITDLFLNRLDPTSHPTFRDLEGLRVSSHFLIDRSGGLIQFVPLDARAWHAGVSVHRGRQRCNDYSVGIELEGIDDGPFEEAQYERLAELIDALRREYPRIGSSSVVGHAEIAPQRKRDPGPHFDWRRVLQGIAR